MELSARLEAVVSLVTAGYTVADIGTDHAYVPISLVGRGISPSAIAMDVRPGPLERARAHVEQYGLEGLIELRLSDGLGKLCPGEADAAVLAGMGGNLVIRILREHKEVASSLKECILQPQSEAARVRAFLLEEGFFFVQENMVLDSGKYYPMMKVVPPGDEALQNMEGQNAWDETQLRYGKLLLESRHPVLKQFLEGKQRLCRQILQGLDRQDGERIRKRRRELSEELEYIWKGLEYYAV